MFQETLAIRKTSCLEIDAFLILYDVNMLVLTEESRDPACGPDPNVHTVSLIGLIKRYEK